ncbi:MAG: Gx transporter family protein [Coriobacteriaceae bacterium]|jgi:heptaprenyl diphosphate synthase|nr:Gx transporter family protein [Coriobacteriaceae bacterium]
MPRAAASQIRSQRIATTGLLVALALVLGWVEAFIPLPVSIPGVKLGLANIAVLFALWRYGIGRAALVMAAKVVAAALLFGGFFALAYSACGSLLAFMGMVLLWRFKETFPLLPVSVVAAVLHNIGQIALASAVISSPLVWLNAPVLVIAACVTGAVTGSVATAVMRALPDQGTKPPAGH